MQVLFSFIGITFYWDDGNDLSFRNYGCFESAYNFLCNVFLRGDWKDLEFKEYNLNAGARPLEYGCDHPLLKVGVEMCHLLDYHFFSQCIAHLK